MLKILIIDDTRSVHTYMKTLLLKTKDVTATSVMNGLEGIEAYENQGPFDLILLDWEMPVMTGPETLKRLVDLGCKTPIVMVTTKNAPSDIAGMLELGATEYMMKPFTADILFEKIETATGKGLNRVA